MTPWITGAWYVFVAASVALAGVHAVVGARTISRRYRLAWTQPDGLASPAFPPAWLSPFTSFCGVLLCVLAILLIVPGSPFWRPDALAGPALFVAGTASSVAIFRSLQGAWSGALAISGSLLLSAGACGLTRSVLFASTGWFAHLHAIAVALAIMSGLWAWLDGVWLQQLDSGRAWTIAGRLLDFTSWFSFANAGAGVVIQWTTTLLEQPGARMNVWLALCVHAVLAGALVLCVRRWWGVGFLFLLMACLAGMLVLIAGRLSTMS